jgi:hypothetical protein
VHPAFAAGALTDWFEDLGAPIRNMHSGTYPPAGKGIALDIIDDPGEEQGCWISAKIVEPTAVTLLDEGIYKDLSVGIFDPELDFTDPTVPGGTIVGGWIGEVSLVDLGSNKNAHVTLVKRANRELPAELLAIVGRSYSKVEKAAASAAWYGLVKRDMDPDVGGGVDRDALDDSDFVIVEGSGDDKKRAFPIVTPADVEDAVQSWGRYKGPTTFEEFKSKLIAMAKKKGPKFVAELPDSWGVSTKKKSKNKKGSAVSDTATATKAKKTPGESSSGSTSSEKPTIPEGSKQCATCKGSGKIHDGNMNCPTCKGKGYVPMAGGSSEDSGKGGKTTKAAEVDPAILAAADDATASAMSAIAAAGLVADVGGAILKAAGQTGAGSAAVLTKDGDDDVDDAVDDLIDDLGEVASAQQADEIEDPGKPTDDDVSDDIAAVAEDVAQLVEDQADDQQADDPNAATPDAGKAAKPVKLKKLKSTKRPKRTKAKSGPTPEEACRAHDAVCPGIGRKDVESLYPGTIKDQISLEFFSKRLARLAGLGSKGKKAQSEIGEAFAAVAAAEKLQSVPLPNFRKLHDAANKQFMDQYPDVEIRPSMISPDQFRRDFLPGANSEVSDSTHVPNPDLKPGIEASDFDRGALTENETRPTLSGGISATGYTGKAKSKKGARLKLKVGKNGGSRMFYTNTAKDDASSAMAILHDHIATRYPGICPMEAVMPGSEIDSDGQAGSPAEMNAMGPDIVDMPSPQDSSGVGTIRPVGGKSKKTKKSSSKKARSQKAKETKKFERAVQKATKPLRQKVARQAKILKTQQKAMSRPDPRFQVRRLGGPANFQPKATPEDRARQEELLELGRSLKTRVHDPNSEVALRAQERMIELGVSPDRLAAILVESD